jgi:NitT/TauT family transport system substrate-binding protein
MRQWKNLCLIAVLALMLIGCSTLGQPESQVSKYEPVTVKINNTININYAPVVLAEKLGYFEEFGIELERVQFSHVSDAIPLLGSGHLDAYAGSINAGFLNILGQDPNIKVVADRGLIRPDDCTFLGLMIRKDLVESGQVQGPDDLAGLSINAVVSNPTGYLLSEYLKGTSLTLDDITFENLPSSTYIDAFANKTLDGIITPEIKLTRTLMAGNAVILAPMEEIVGYYQSSALAFGKSLIKDNPDLGVRFMAAYIKGLEKYQEGKTEENLGILHEVTKLDIELLEEACWVYIHPEGEIDFQNIVPFMTWAVEQGHLNGPITEEEYWDPSFLQEARALLDG